MSQTKWLKRRKRNQTERRRSGSNNTMKTTGKYKRTKITSQGDTIHGKISSETLGTNIRTEKITGKN